MRVSELRLNNYRNYQELTVKLSPGTTLFFGENGQGKTNLVEALAYLAHFQSHRTNGYQSIIREGGKSAQLGATAAHLERNLQIAIELNSDLANRYWLNGSLRKKASDLAGVISAVVFSPEDIDIIRREPSDRRQFLDHLLIQLSPKMSSVLADYDRVLKQRNTLLKTTKNNSDLGTLEIWDDQLVNLGLKIMLGRQKLIDDLGPLLSEFYTALIGRTADVSLSLETTVFDSSAWVELDAEAARLAFLEKLTTMRDREIERGITMLGPHRDELVFWLDGRVAREHASQGEAWSLAIGAKLSSAAMIRNQSLTGDPILILDDVFAVLDPSRRERLATFVSANEQVFITATSISDLPTIEWAAKHRVQNGVLE